MVNKTAANHNEKTAVDMSPNAISARLEKAGQLYELAQMLKSAKRIDSNPDSKRRSAIKPNAGTGS